MSTSEASITPVEDDKASKESTEQTARISTASVATTITSAADQPLRRSHRGKRSGMQGFFEDKIATCKTATGLEYFTGDFVYYEDSQRRSWRIGQAEEFRLRRETMVCSVKLFYRSDEVPEQGKQALRDREINSFGANPPTMRQEVANRELFICDATDTVPVATFRGKCQVTHYPEWSQASRMFRPGEDQFFYTFSFNPETLRLSSMRCEIKVGDHYQADLPQCRGISNLNVDGEKKPGRIARDDKGKQWEELMWIPGQIDKLQITNCLIACRSISAFAVLSSSAAAMASEVSESVHSLPNGNSEESSVDADTEQDTEESVGASTSAILQLGMNPAVSEFVHPRCRASADTGYQAMLEDDATQHVYDCLHRNKYRVADAMNEFVKQPCNKSSPIFWREEEERQFARGIRSSGKNFHVILKDFLPHRNMKDLIRYYYYWKFQRGTVGARNQGRTRRSANFAMAAASVAAAAAASTDPASPANSTTSVRGKSANQSVLNARTVSTRQRPSRQATPSGDDTAVEEEEEEDEGDTGEETTGEGDNDEAIDPSVCRNCGVERPYSPSSADSERSERQLHGSLIGLCPRCRIYLQKYSVARPIPSPGALEVDNLACPENREEGTVDTDANSAANVSPIPSIVAPAKISPTACKSRQPSNNQPSIDAEQLSKSQLDQQQADDRVRKEATRKEEEDEEEDEEEEEEEDNSTSSSTSSSSSSSGGSSSSSGSSSGTSSDESDGEENPPLIGDVTTEEDVEGKLRHQQQQQEHFQLQAAAKEMAMDLSITETKIWQVPTASSLGLSENLKPLVETRVTSCPPATGDRGDGVENKKAESVKEKDEASSEGKESIPVPIASLPFTESPSQAPLPSSSSSSKSEPQEASIETPQPNDDSLPPPPQSSPPPKACSLPFPAPSCSSSGEEKKSRIRFLRVWDRRGGANSCARTDLEVVWSAEYSGGEGGGKRRKVENETKPGVAVSGTAAAASGQPSGAASQVLKNGSGSAPFTASGSANNPPPIRRPAATTPNPSHSSNAGGPGGGRVSVGPPSLPPLRKPGQDPAHILAAMAAQQQQQQRMMNDAATAALIAASQRPQGGPPPPPPPPPPPGPFPGPGGPPHGPPPSPHQAAMMEYYRLVSGGWTPGMPVPFPLPPGAPSPQEIAAERHAEMARYAMAEAAAMAEHQRRQQQEVEISRMLQAAIASGQHPGLPPNMVGGPPMMGGPEWEQVLRQMQAQHAAAAQASGPPNQEALRSYLMAQFEQQQQHAAQAAAQGAGVPPGGLFGPGLPHGPPPPPGLPGHPGQLNPFEQQMLMERGALPPR